MIKYIGICGAPTAGKSEVQKILFELFGVEPIDDSRPIREAAMILYDLSEEDVTTQEGKSRVINIGGKEVVIRQILGEIGDHIEERDPLHLPNQAKRTAQRQFPGKRVSMASVRKSQGQAFQDEDSLLIEVVRPGVTPKNSFDRYDPELAHVTLVNDYNPDDKKGSSERLKNEAYQKLSRFLSS